jgi:hypothetical protein
MTTGRGDKDLPVAASTDDAAGGEGENNVTTPEAPGRKWRWRGGAVFFFQQREAAFSSRNCRVGCVGGC